MTTTPNMPHIPRLRASYPPVHDFERRNPRAEALDIVSETVKDHVRDLGRVATWTVRQLNDQHIQPDITLETASEKIGTGWQFWKSEKAFYSWCLLSNATLQMYVAQGKQAIVEAYDPADHCIDFESGRLKKNVDQSNIDNYRIAPSDGEALLDIVGVDYRATTDKRPLLPSLYPQLGGYVRQYQAAEGWRNAFSEFLSHRHLPQLPVDL